MNGSMTTLGQSRELRTRDPLLWPPGPPPPPPLSKGMLERGRGRCMRNLLSPAPLGGGPSMSAPDIGITDADRRKMGEWAENGVRSDAQRGVSRNRPKAPEEDDMADPERTTADKDVTRRKCERIRERSLDGEPYSAIADDLHLSLSTISRHVTGKCSHERAVTIDDRRCAVIRSLAHDGMSYAEIARELGWGERQTISDHGRGFCSHDIDIPPLNNRE